MTADDICSEILRSKKYSRIYRPVVRRVCVEEYSKYKKDSERIKAVKTKLHTLHGAYADEKIYKKTASLLDGVTDADDLTRVSAEILHLHASTSERAGMINEFYDFIFKHIDGGTILDVGCGYNPFSMPFMPLKPAAYHAFDIDENAAPMINRFYNLYGTARAYSYSCIDIITETPRQYADVAFLFKLLPVVENQKPWRGFELINELNAEKIIVTYPLKSLGGRAKGMDRHYPEVFESSLSDGFEIIGKKEFGNELVYVLYNDQKVKNNSK